MKTKKNILTITRLIAVVLILILIKYAAYSQPDLPNPPANIETIPAGSYIIPMDNDKQTISSTSSCDPSFTVFNLKAYGLIYELLDNGIPVKWIIKSGKGKDENDFTALSSRIFPTTQSESLTDYRASAFIIDIDDVQGSGCEPSLNPFENVDSIIIAYGNNVQVYELSNSIDMDVRYRLNIPPKIATLTDGDYPLIHQSYLDKAGIPYTTMQVAEFIQDYECYSFISQPHIENFQVTNEYVQGVNDFVSGGGNFFAQCHGILAYENTVNMQTTNGLLNGVDVPDYLQNVYQNNDLAIMQFEGEVNTGWGSVSWFHLNTSAGSDWKSYSYSGITNTSSGDISYIVTGADLNNASPGGNIFYAGGHDYNGIFFAGVPSGDPFDPCDNENIERYNAMRIYLNAVFIQSYYTACAGPDMCICQGESVQLGCDDTGLSDGDVVWTPSTGLSCTDCPNPIASPAITTTYTIAFTDNDCSSDEVTVFIEYCGCQTPDVPFEIAPPLCYGDEVNIIYTGPGLGTNDTTELVDPAYLWDIDGGTLISGVLAGSGVPSDLSVLYSIAGTYDITLEVTNHLNGDTCQTSTYTLQVIVPEELNSNISGTDIYCFGGEDGAVDLTVNGGTIPYFYEWSTGATTEDINSLSVGTYTITVTDSNGCTTINSIIITEPPQLTSSISGTDILCAGDEIGSAGVSVSGGTPPYTYFWQPTNETSDYIDGLAQGEYTVLVTDDNGCTVTNSITIDEPYPIETQMSGIDLLCYGDVSNGSAEVTASGGTEPYLYSWSNGANTQTITNIGADTYTVTVTDQNGCTSGDNITINEPPELIVTIPEPDWICIGESVTITANTTGGTPGYSYEWNDGIMEEWNIVNPGVTTNYSVSATDANGCQTSANVTVNVHPPVDLYVYASEDSLCPGDAVDIYVNPLSGTGGPYEISVQGNGIYFTGNVSDIPFTIYPSQTGTYNITVSDECTEAYDSLTIYVLPVPDVQFVSDVTEGCEPLTVHFNEWSPDEGQTYMWDFGDEYSGNYSVIQNPVHIYENAGTYDVTLTITSAAGCINTFTWQDMITVYPNPVASFMANPQVATIIKPVIYFENLSSTYYYSHWDFGDGDESGATHPVHHYDNTGGFTVQLIVMTEHCCPDTVYQDVIVNDIHTFYAPTAFSPDNNSMNDLFSPVGHGIDSDHWKLIIYDRWGEKVWETSIYDVDEETGKVNHGWDGTIRGGDIGETGVYSWLVIYRDLSGAEHQRAGLISLIR